MQSLRATIWTALVLGVTATAGACQDPSGPTPPASAGLRVLFVGNSLTYYNDLPETFAAVARGAGSSLVVEMFAQPNYGLVDHLRVSGAVEAAIRTGDWDYVVLQQGPSTQPDSRDSLVAWTRLFDPIIRSAGATPALYMVWPPKGQAGGFDAARTSYQAAAAAVNGIFLPAGAAWQEALSQDAGLALYGPDNFHPSPLGTYLAAITIYEALTGFDPRQLPPSAHANGTTLTVPPATVRLLQDAAYEANRRY
jgi:hypothetical protein